MLLMILESLSELLLLVSFTLILLFWINFIASSNFLHCDLELTALQSGHYDSWKLFGPVRGILWNRQTFQETFHVSILIFSHFHNFIKGFVTAAFIQLFLENRSP